MSSVRNYKLLSVWPYKEQTVRFCFFDIPEIFSCLPPLSPVTIAKPDTMTTREWGNASVKEIRQRLHRGSSIISRLYSAYAAERDPNRETLMIKLLQQ